MTDQEWRLGFIGLGDMGAPMVRNLLAAGYSVHVHDIERSKVAALVEEGAVGSGDVADVVARADIILTSLPSSEVWVDVAEEQILPHARQGQVVIDLGTVTPPQTRRLADLFADKGATLMDVPVSGGSGGAQRGDLYMFVGGDEDTFYKVRSLLETLGGPDKITYCGPAGSGQVVKGVNQLMMGLMAAAALEAVAFGVRGGVDAATVRDAIGDSGAMREYFNRIAARVAEGQGENVGVKFRELPYFLNEAVVDGFQLPLTQILYGYCNQGERVVIDDHRPAPSFWHELMEAADEP